MFCDKFSLTTTLWAKPPLSFNPSNVPAPKSPKEKTTYLQKAFNKFNTKQTVLPPIPTSLFTTLLNYILHITTIIGYKLHFKQLCHQIVNFYNKCILV